MSSDMMSMMFGCDRLPDLAARAVDASAPGPASAAAAMPMDFKNDLRESACITVSLLERMPIVCCDIPLPMPTQSLRGL